MHSCYYSNFFSIINNLAENIDKRAVCSRMFNTSGLSHDNIKSIFPL